MLPKISIQKTPVFSGLLKTPIYVASKPLHLSTSKKLNRISTPLVDDRCHPDPQDTWESMLPKVKTDGLLCKRKYSAPSLTAVNLSFGNELDKALHGKI